MDSRSAKAGQLGRDERCVGWGCILMLSSLRTLFPSFLLVCYPCNTIQQQKADDGQQTSTQMHMHQKDKRLPTDQCYLAS